MIWPAQIYHQLLYAAKEAVTKDFDLLPSDSVVKLQCKLCQSANSHAVDTVSVSNLLAIPE